MNNAKPSPAHQGNHGSQSIPQRQKRPDKEWKETHPLLKRPNIYLLTEDPSALKET